MTRYYLAASSHEMDRAERIMQALDAAGFVCTHNWISGVRDAFARGIAEAKLDDAHALEAARADLAGVAAADVLVFLCPTHAAKGAWFEAGFANALGIPIVIAHDSYERRNQSIFTRLGVPVPDAGIVNAVRDVTRERSPMLSKMVFVRWIAGQVIAHQVKLERAHDATRIDSLRAQIAGDLQLIATRSIDATHAFFSRAA
jgi:hypothetical protein